MNANSLAKALSGNLTYHPEELRSLDKLAALAVGSIRAVANPVERGIAAKWGGQPPEQRAARESHLNSLGVSLIAFKHAHRPDYYLQAVRQLGHALGWRKVKNRGAVARTAVNEWVVDLCEVCCGAREVTNQGVTRPCLPCGQTGKRRYSDEERRGIPGKAMSEAHSLISLAVSVAIRGAAKQLEEQDTFK